MTTSWIFGYGSLLWRPSFPYESRYPAYVDGFARKFWQASPLHRGTKSVPGRVVTLLAKPASRCWGMAYQIRKSEAEGILAALDHRERTGYERAQVTLHVHSVGAISNVLVYVAAPNNRNFIGPESDFDTAKIIGEATGESGSNVDYLHKLASALSDMQVHDSHVEALVQAVGTNY